jgi:hypothetical protein
MKFLEGISKTSKAGPHLVYGESRYWLDEGSLWKDETNHPRIIQTTDINFEFNEYELIQSAPKIQTGDFVFYNFYPSYRSEHGSEYVKVNFISKDTITLITSNGRVMSGNIKYSLYLRIDFISSNNTLVLSTPDGIKLYNSRYSYECKEFYGGEV